MSDEEEKEGQEEEERVEGNGENETPGEEEGPKAEKIETPAAPQQPDNSLKIVINLKDNRAHIGIQSPNCDPVFATAEGSMDKIFKAVKLEIEHARAIWKTSPRNPKIDLPHPAPSPVSAAQKTGSNSKTVPPRSTPQRQMF